MRRYPQILAHWLTYSAAAIVFILMGLTLIDVVGRYFFNTPLVGGFEITELSMGVLVFITLPQLTLDNRHLKVELFTNQLPPVATHAISLLTPLLSTIVLIFLAVQLGDQGNSLNAYHETTATLHLPVGPLAYFMSGMCVISALVAIAQIFTPHGRV